MKMIKLIGLLGVCLAGAVFAQDPAQLGKISASGDMKEVKIEVPLKSGDAVVRAVSPSKSGENILLDVVPAVLSGAGEEAPVYGMLVTKIKSEQYDKSVVRYTLTTSVRCDFTVLSAKGSVGLSLKPASAVTPAPKQAAVKEPAAKPAQAKPVEDSAGSMDKVAQVTGDEVAKTESKSSDSELVFGHVIGKKGNIDQLVEHINILNADLPSLLNMLCTEAGFNLVTSKSISGTIPSIQLSNVTLRKVLDLILKQNGYAYEIEGNIIRIATPAEINTETESALLETRTYGLSFAKAAIVSGTIQPFLSSKGKIQADARTNALIVTDISKKQEEVAGLVKKLDEKTAQVSIEAKLLDINYTAEQNLGIRWDVQGGGQTSPIGTDIYPPGGNSVFRGTVAPAQATTSNSGSLQFGVAGATNFWASLNMLIQNNEANVKASPRITTLDNTTATMNISQAYPYLASYNQSTGVASYSSVDAGVTLSVTPQVNRNGFITLQVIPTVSSVVNPGPPPVVDSRTASTTVLVKDGETLVIGGMLRDDETKVVAKVPILGDIPLLGPLLFSSTYTKTTKRDLVVLITPRILE